MAVYMLLLLGVGIHFARKKNTLKGYLLADQDVHWVIVGISVMAALFSGISYLGAPAETFFHDLRYLWVLASFLIATPVTTLVFLPLFRRVKLFTAYEYLERRFDNRLRKIASMLFLLRVVFYLGLATYAPALAIVDVTGWPLWVCVLSTGAIATVYTAFGGMKAVVWTDTIQFLILCGGIFIILGVAIYHIPGGLPAAWHYAAHDGKTKLWNFSLDPTVRITIWGGLIGGACLNLIQLATDQIAVQRYITAATLRDSQRALWLKFWVTLPLVGLFYLTGTVLYGYYRAFPQRVPAFVNASLVPGLAKAAGSAAAPLLNDRLLPYFVTRELPSPLPGLLIAAILGATIAVVSSGINALATATLMDFKRPSAPGVKSNDQREVSSARRLTVYFGVVVTLLALFVIPYFGSLVEAIGRITGLFGGPLLGVFCLGAFSRRANGTGTLIGAVVGSTIGTLVTFSQPLFGYPISFLWIAVVATLATYGAGVMASYFFPPPTPSALAMTCRPSAFDTAEQARTIVAADSNVPVEP
jgi:sodium-coupled monocarboxylate transporter 8/12